VRPLAIEVAGAGKRFRRSADRRTSLKELIVRGRSRHVEEFWALRDVSLAIPKGSVYGVVGHNGSGKSTLLKLMAGISRPSEGQLHVDGRLAALIELGAGFHPDLTGRDNIRLNGSILGLTKHEVASAAGEIIEFSGLGDFIDEPVKNYSSGMYVRLGFSVAVHMRPDVLLIDEIIAVGDEDFQRRCFDHLYALRQSGKTIVIVSHASTLMGSLCDEVAWLDHGRLRDSGPAQTVIDGYVDSVNADDGASPGGHGGRDSTQRQGSGLIRLSSVESIDVDGAPSAACVSGQPLRLRIAFEAYEAVQDPVISVSFQHESGPIVTSVTTRATGERLGVLDGPGRIDYVQDPCRLNPGNYAVHASALDASGTHVFDAWPRALDLVVRAGPGAARGGLVSLSDAFETRARAVDPGGA
jgi:ABC-type polysaccharide/polyol phosphate transport system ATPase subunit